MENKTEFDALRFFTIDEVAARFRVSRRTLLRHLRAHPHYRSLGRTKLFTEADISHIHETLRCPSNSKNRAQARRRTTPSGAPTWESTLTEALELVNEK